MTSFSFSAIWFKRSLTSFLTASSDSFFVILSVFMCSFWPKRWELRKGYIYDEETDDSKEVKYDKDNVTEVFLGSVKGYVKRALKSEGEALTNENKYHTSTCFG